MSNEDKNSLITATTKRRRLYRFLVMLFFAFFVMGVNIPIFDYTKRESLAYIKEPSQRNLEALRAKQAEERRTQWLYSSPL